MPTNENQVLRYGQLKGLAATEEQMTLINRQSLRELAAQEVFTFKIAACNNQVDRDFERFTDETLQELSKLYVGKTVIADHNWTAGNQCARVYDALVEPMAGTAGGKQLVLLCYMLKNADTQSTIDAIEGGILREVSVGCSCREAICNICGADKRKTYCEHRRGADYGGATCVVELKAATDAYEVSFVAVPAQPAAGVTKTYGGEENKPPESQGSSATDKNLDLKIKQWEASLFVLAQEENETEEKE